ncbi:DUF4293 domain-containing protein [Hoylesella saccharolytica]|uniref:DUF4293 domain-containing protein n=1 Tax=Hoylesella saccharolytica TaxID=633701 RepID=UPI0028D57335|nr:DUF4293 domain-containing protein [Hoylesella saccharolytica]
MLQRKQTLFIFIAIILSVVCMCVPIGHFEPRGMGMNAILYNLWIRDVVNGVNVTSSILFIMLLHTCPFGIWAIFKYKNRIFQARLCVINILFLVTWYIAYFVYGYYWGYRDYTFKMKFAACLPLISLILYVMARHAILADEKLVRSADRIR